MQDLSKRDYDKWYVTETYIKKGKHTLWLCRCVCGKEKYVYATNLTCGKSSGCHRCSIMRHGKTHTPEHVAWLNMRARCFRKQHPEYKDYGGRGITICDRWGVFENFLSDMGERPGKGYSIGRINNNGPYSPENCQWETERQQHSNKRSNVWITHDGRTQTLSQWCEEMNRSATFVRNMFKEQFAENAERKSRELPKQKPSPKHTTSIGEDQ